MSELRVREIPFDLGKALRSESVAALVKDFGAPAVTAALALSVFTEFFELLLHHLHRANGLLAERDDTRPFLQQELRHASALHVVNRTLVGDTYEPGPTGRVSAICREVFADDLARVEAGLDPEALARYSHWIAVTELIVGLPAALVEFSQLEADSQGLRLRHPAFFYVFLYHAAEEAEHTHVTWEYHRDRFGLDVLGPDGLPESEKLFDAFLDDHAAIMRLVAKKLGLAVPESAIAEVPMRAMLRRHLDGLRDKGAEPTLYATLRQSCVDAWDKRWEPIFRRRAQAAASA